jgi:hypothetical protein
MPKKEVNTVDYWISEIGRADEKRREAASKYEWDKLLEIWNNGGADVGLVTNSDVSSTEFPANSAFVNWVWAYVQSFIPAVYWRHPQVYLDPMKSSYIKAAKIAQVKTNWGFKVTRAPEMVKKTILDALLFGMGWIKLGWHTELGQVPKNAAPQDVRNSSESDYELYLKKNAPYAYRVAPDRIYVDPEATSIDDAMWICQENYRPYELVKNDPQYSHRKDFTSYHFPDNFNPTPIGKKREVTSGKKAKEWARIFEIWDRERERVVFIIDGSKEFNRTIEPWPYTKVYGFPFEPLSFTMAVDEFYPPSLILPWLPLVEELAFIRSTRMDHMARMVTKFLIPEDAATEEQLRKFEDPDQELVVMNDPERVREISGLKPDPQLYASEEKVKEDIREISGFSELISGSIPFSRVSATTSAIMERNASIRFDHAGEIVGEFLTKMAEKLYGIIYEYQRYPDEVRLTGDPSVPPIEYTKEDIDGEFFFSINVEDMAIVSRQTKIKNAYDALTALAQFPEVRRWPLIRDLVVAFGHEDFDEYLHPEAGPPMDPSYENELMIQGIPVPPNPKEDFKTHLEIHQQYIQQDFAREAFARAPQVAALFSEHIQLTLRMYEQYQAQMGLQGGGGGAQGVPPPSIQQGAALAGSAPVGGARNTQGPQGNPLLQALGGQAGA